MALPKGNVDLAHLHLQVLLSLHSIGADVGQPIAIERKGGVLLVHGVVASDEDAKRIRAALALFVSYPYFKEDIASVNEFLRRARNQAQTQRISVEQYEVTVAHIPIESMLRSHFASVGLVGNQVDTQIQTYTHTVLAQSGAVLQNAWTLQQFSRGFSQEELESLSSTDQSAWFALLNEHAASLRESLEALHSSISWMETAEIRQAETGPTEPLRVPKSYSTRVVVERLLNESQNLDQLVRAAFVATSVKDSDQLVDPQKMQRSLSEARAEVLGIQKVSQDYSAILRVP
jgi:hypothetical protein